MAKYKLVFEDIKRDGKDGFSVHIEDEDDNKLEHLEIDIDDVTMALEEVLSQWAQYQFTADQLLDADDNLIGGLDFEEPAGTKH